MDGAKIQGTAAVVEKSRKTKSSLEPPMLMSPFYMLTPAQWDCRGQDEAFALLYMIEKEVIGLKGMGAGHRH